MDARRALFSGIGHQSQPNTELPVKSDSYVIGKLVGQHLAAMNRARISSKYQSPNKKLFVHLSMGSMATLYPVDYDEKIGERDIQLSMPVRCAFGLTLGESSFVSIVTTDINQFRSAGAVDVVIEKCFPNPSLQRRINIPELKEMLIDGLNDYPLNPGQVLMIQYDDVVKVQLKIAAIDGVVNCNNVATSLKNIATINHDTQLSIAASKQSPIILSGSDTLPVLSLDFAEEGVGGHKRQLAQVLREGFYSRLMPAAYSRLYGVKHTKGILLYGPPGTGKTLIARVIGSRFSKDNVKVVNGSELKNKYVGQSVDNLRAVFADAQAAWVRDGDESDLHVIIFDEIDAMCPARGTRTGGTGVDDDMVSQLLTILDGVDSPQNILIIGMTNRKDLIDPALLRPGRLEVHVEIGLPDLAERLEILTIKTKKMNKGGLLGQDVKLDEYAAKTVNFTGAELEQLVKKSVFFAMGNNFDEDNQKQLVMKSQINHQQQLAKVTQAHFEKALTTIKPVFGIDAALLRFDSKHFVIYSQALSGLIDDFKKNLTTLASNESMHVISYLIAGRSGTGKTQLAMKFAYSTGAKFVKIITPDDVSMMEVKKQITYIDEVFENLSRVDHSVLILDSLESLIGADAERVTYHNVLRLKYEAKLKELAESGNKCVVIATTRDANFINRISLGDLFNETKELTPVSLDQASALTVIAQLAEAMGYRLSSTTSHFNGCVMLPIRDLIYQLRKYMAMNGASELPLHQFLETLKNSDHVPVSTPRFYQVDTAPGMKGRLSRS